jgi:hypothetical protein
LVAFEQESEGEITYPYGRDAKGLLIYEGSGHMSVQIMRDDRAPLSSSDWEIDDANRTVIHHVEGHILPASVGKALKREFEFSGDRLTLKPAPGRRAVWERARAGNNSQKNGD